MPGQEAQQAAGAGADIQQVGGPVGLEQALQLGLDQGTVDAEVALAVPARGPAVEIAFGLLAAGLAHGGETLPVEHQRRIVVGQQAAERARHPRTLAALGPAVEHPAALAEAVEQAGLGQDLEVARDARLALAQHLDQLAHRPLALGADREQAQPRRVGSGPDPGQQMRQRLGQGSSSSRFA